MRLSVTRLTGRVVLIVIGALIVLGGMSVFGALGASNDSVYSACVDRRNGTPYNITTGSSIRCRTGDSVIRWNQTGPQGEQGPPGVSNFRAETGDWVLINAGSDDVAVAACPEDKIPMSGGHQISFDGQSGARALVYGSFAVAGNSTDDPSLNFPTDSAVPGDRYGWKLSVHNPHPTDSFSVRAVAYCADIE